MVALKEFSAEGVAITDELVRCNEAVVVGGVTYYRGYLANTANGNIYGNDSPTYGVWTAAAKGGTRKLVAIAGYPGDAATVAIDLKNGWLYSTQAGTFYVRYLAHEPIKHNISNVSIEVPYLLKATVAKTLAAIKLPYFAKFGFVSVAVSGGAPSADATVTISNGTESATFTLAATQPQAAVELATPFKVNVGETLTVSTADGKGAYGFVIRLMDV